MGVRFLVVGGGEALSVGYQRAQRAIFEDISERKHWDMSELDLRISASESS